MKIIFHRNFEKKYQKLPENIKLKIKEKNIIFANDPFDPILNNHALNGKFLGYRSINISGNIRAIYKLVTIDVALFTNIGTHSDLYK